MPPTRRIRLSGLRAREGLPELSDSDFRLPMGGLRLPIGDLPTAVGNRIPLELRWSFRYGISMVGRLQTGLAVPGRASVAPAVPPKANSCYLNIARTPEKGVVEGHPTGERFIVSK